MTHRFLLQYLAEACQALNDTRLPPIKKVYFPNEIIPEDAYEQNVFFEVFTGDEAPVWDTEKTSVSTVVGSIVINGKQSVGASLLDAIAEALIKPFLPRTPFRKIGFTTPSCDGENLDDVYVIGAERSEGGIDNGRYKITIFLTFEIYED